jgi:hypothetical protein
MFDLLIQPWLWLAADIFKVLNWSLFKVWNLSLSLYSITEISSLLSFPNRFLEFEITGLRSSTRSINFLIRILFPDSIRVLLIDDPIRLNLKTAVYGISSGDACVSISFHCGDAIGWRAYYLALAAAVYLIWGGLRGITTSFLLSIAGMITGSRLTL